jgi:VanZ family protein
MEKRPLLLLSAIIVFIGITVLSLLPPKSGVELPTNDKVGHFIAYGTFAMNISLLFNRWKKELLFSLIGIVLYGILIEFLQGFVRRETSFYDFLANTAGVAIGVTIITLFRRPITTFLAKINVISLNEK